MTRRINGASAAQMFEEVNQMIEKFDNKRRGGSYADEEEVHQ
jgi:cell fate (sporulation/competence/biofilm development) regulator YlbF (YheA/YmcA/DUF963 family)